jgi:8-oxo-dGTP pyrophosphatase MutT (NUDIX family)
VKRAALLADLAAYLPVDERECEMRDRIARFVGEQAECFERTLQSGHVTGSAWVIDPSRTAVLLTHHRKLGKWLQFGGHADGEADIRAVALREAREESGIAELRPAQAGIYDVDVHEIPARGEEPAHFHYDVRYAFFAERAAAPTVSEESYDVRWFSLPEAAALPIDASVRRLIAKTSTLS